MSHFRIIAVVCTAQVLAQIGAFAIPALLPTFIADWNLSGTEAGWIIGAFYVSYTLTVPVLVSLTDRMDPKRIYLGAVAFTAIAALGYATLADGFWSAFAFRLLAGVGWAGKHTLALGETRGSYAFLGELLLEAELEPDAPVPQRCGTCTSCIDVCPTGAIEDGFRLDPRRCISYLTIEHRGTIAAELRPLLGAWVFGCDLCQLVCPWNDERASPPADALAPSLPELLALGADDFDARYGTSAVRRTGRIGLARNAAVVLGNTGNPDAAAPLATALASHEAPLVRRHAAGALTALLSAAPTARTALERARSDPDPDVRADAEAGLARS